MCSWLMHVYIMSGRNTICRLGWGDTEGLFQDKSSGLVNRERRGKKTFYNLFKSRLKPLYEQSGLKTIGVACDRSAKSNGKLS